MKIEAVWSEYQGALKAFLHKNVSDPDDVDDLLQEVLIKSFNNLSAVKDASKMKSWLFQVANNTLIDFYRKRGKTHDIDEEDLWHGESEENIIGELSDCIMPFIDALPDNQAALLRAIELEGVSQKEYAEQQGIKYSTLKSQVQKSRQNLLGLFKQCCDFSIDSRGNIMTYEQKSSDCSGC
ncbi:RNA polymerase sigma factor sigZ [Vibrio ishigakensis]|uniref:RNA polymerase sigma factor n=1 Tax=Vibrio ishigakensis TaxID=1481914 RepID=A0A0B8QPN2_9VIBR|nr:RNA polymerase sigma factor sigZ [Vibrio ishigakensis]